MNKSQRTIDLKTSVLVMAIVSMGAVFINIDVVTAVKLKTELILVMSVVIAASGLALYKPEAVKDFTSQITTALCILVVAMSALRFLVGDLVEPVWAVMCLSLMTSLISQGVADAKLMYPTLVEVMTYKATEIE